MKKFLSLFLVSILCITLFAGCNTAEPSDNSNNSDTDEKKEIIMYTNANFPPFEYKEGTDVVGIDVEIGKRVAEKLGKTLKIEDTNFDGIVAAIASGKGDFAISGITITDERKEKVDFSNPYFTSVQYLILPKDSEIQTMDDLAGKKIGAALGYTGSLILDDEMNLDKGALKDKGATLTDYASAVDATLDLNNGKLDAVVMDEFVAKNIADKDDNLKVIKLVYADGSDTAETYGVAVQKGKDDLLNTINEVIKEMIDSGELDRLTLEHSNA